MNASSSAPDLLRHNPETEEEEIAGVFLELYQLARSHFCYRVSTSPYVESVWQAMMRNKWSPKATNPVDYEERFGHMIQVVWDEMRPAIGEAGEFVDKDPTLLNVHPELLHTFGHSIKDIVPERVALHNLRMWVTQSLHWFWEHRLDGEKVAVFRVTRESVELKGVLPEEVVRQYSDAPHINEFTY